MLRRLEEVGSPADPAMLVGLGDDAAVRLLPDGSALVFTIDYFTPIVDDAATWGAIAAANALSDVYAMGGTPLMCLNVAGWPRDALPLDLLGDVLAGGARVAAEAGAAVVGGHTVDNPEPLYGMAVVGIASPREITTIDAARPGDVLVLTKPLGLGVISTAVKNGLAPPGVAEEAVRVMTALNEGAARAMGSAGVRAATDVTGFGLLGHLRRMLVASRVSARVEASRVPLIEGAAALAGAGMVPSGSVRNRADAETATRWDSGVDEVGRILLTDAQTSGGLLIACPEPALGGLTRAILGTGACAEVIGSVAAGEPGTIHVVA